MKAKRYLAMLLIASLLLCTGCAGSNGQKAATDSILAQIGQTKEAACAALGIKQDDLREVKNGSGVFETPVKAEYAGVEFSVVLSFDQNDQKLWNVQYVASYENDAQTAARDIIAVAKKLVEENGEAKQAPVTDRSIHTIAASDIPNVYEDIFSGQYSEGYLWVLTDPAENIQEYIASFDGEKSKSYKQTLAWEWDEEQKVATVKLAWYVSL